MNKTEIHIPKHKIKQIGLFLASVVFVTIAYKMINSEFESSRMSPETATIFGYLGIVFFGFGGMLIFFNLLTSKPALTLNSEGIINNSHVGGGYLIRWENIELLRIITISKQRMIEIDLNDEDEIYQQVNILARSWMKVNGRFMGTPVFIPSVMIKMELDEVLHIIREQKRNHSNSRLKSNRISDETNEQTC